MEMTLWWSPTGQYRSNLHVGSDSTKGINLEAKKEAALLTDVASLFLLQVLIPSDGGWP